MTMKLSFLRIMRDYAIGMAAFHLWKLYRGDPLPNVLVDYGVSLVLGAIIYWIGAALIVIFRRRLHHLSGVACTSEETLQ